MYSEFERYCTKCRKWLDSITSPNHDCIPVAPEPKQRRKLKLSGGHRSVYLHDLEAEANCQLQSYLDRIKELEGKEKYLQNGIREFTEDNIKLSRKVSELEAMMLTPIEAQAIIDVYIDESCTSEAGY